MRTMILLGLLGLTPSCATTTAAYVESQHGWSVTKGRLLTVDGMNAEAVTDLSDGVAFQLLAGTCSVSMRFEDGNERTISLTPPAMIVCGGDTQYVLQPLEGVPATR